MLHGQKASNLCRRLPDDNSRYVYTMDSQAIKLCPVLNVSAYYYKTKLPILNFTMLSASVFVTNILEQLKTNYLTEKENIIIFSYRCGYQNRNIILGNALLYFSIQNDIILEQKFLEKGHMV